MLARRHELIERVGATTTSLSHLFPVFNDLLVVTGDVVRHVLLHVDVQLSWDYLRPEAQHG